MTIIVVVVGVLVGAYFTVDLVVVPQLEHLWAELVAWWQQATAGRSA